MTSFITPFSDLNGWDFAPEAKVVIPIGLRYGGVTGRGLKATRAATADVLTPAAGILRQLQGTDGSMAIELQVNPFPMRDLISSLPFGLPTFYFFFEAAPPFAFEDGDIESEGAVLTAVDSATLVMIGQDRVVRDPATWTRAIADAITDPSPDGWVAFDTAVDATLNSPAHRPILILDHRGRLAEQAAVSLVIGPTGAETVQDIDLLPDDAGDLQTALRRLGLPDDPFASGGEVRIRQRGGDVQFTRLEDEAAAGEIVLTPNSRQIQMTDLETWFAPQFAIPENAAASPLKRYSRGNRLTPFINGRSFYRAFFDLLSEIDEAGQGVHLTGGFSLEADAELLELQPQDAPDRPTTIKDALEEIVIKLPSVDDGVGRFLSAKFFQIEPDQTLSQREIAAFYFLVGVIGVTNMANLGLNGLKTDGSGFALLVLISLLNHNLVNDFIDENGEPLEFMREAVELLDNPALRSINKFSKHPATVDDNPLAPSGFPFDAIFPFIRHFGLYHQKIAVIHNRNGGFGFCGGIDMSANRVDDADHNVSGPYHDVHAMVEGEAVLDVATTFEQRWARDGVDASGALSTVFDVADLAPNANIGRDIVQMARTYPAVQDAARRLEFAPLGDRTILDSTLNAISQAKEYIHIEDQYFTPPPVYVDALVNRIASGTLQKLIITLPTASDQPFGETSRAQTVAALRSAESSVGAAPGEIVKIGILRRHFTVASNSLRAASGKLLLGEEMIAQPADPGFDETITLGPKARVPLPPFWLAIDGELMWVYDEAPSLGTDPPSEDFGRYLTDRGQRTRLFGLGTGARPRTHAEGAAATVVDLKGIFVHAKLILVDDVFAGIGSANVNRRGFYSDGEGHFFWMPEGLKTKPPTGANSSHNPIARLRHELWAEFLNLPYPMAAPLLEDPIAASDLFDRLPIHGNRFTPPDAIPLNLEFGALYGGDSIIASVLQTLFTTLVSIDHQAIFDGIVDPTTDLEQLP